MTDLITIARDKLAAAIKTANDADELFEAVIRAAGYKSRWDWSQFADRAPLAAYLAKVKADEAQHEAFEKMRAIQRACR